MLRAVLTRTIFRRSVRFSWYTAPVGLCSVCLAGVNFMEKTISVRRTTITFSIWDLGGQREFVNMLPLVCNDAVAILFMFDLSRKSTLNSVKEWYRQARGFNKVCKPLSFETSVHLSCAHRLQYPFSLVPSLTSLPHSLGMSRRRSPNRFVRFCYAYGLA